MYGGLQFPHGWRNSRESHGTDRSGTQGEKRIHTA